MRESGMKAYARVSIQLCHNREVRDRGYTHTCVKLMDDNLFIAAGKGGMDGGVVCVEYTIKGNVVYKRIKYNII